MAVNFISYPQNSIPQFSMPLLSFPSYVVTPVVPVIVKRSVPHYVHPLANSLLAGTLVSELIDTDFDGKNIDPYKQKRN